MKTLLKAFEIFCVGFCFILAFGFGSCGLISAGAFLSKLPRFSPDSGAWLAIAGLLILIAYVFGRGGFAILKSIQRDEAQQGENPDE